MQTLSQFKLNILFLQKIRMFREKVFVRVSQLCRDKNKLNFDAMAELILDDEKNDDSVGIIEQAIVNISTIAPSIQKAEKKLNILLDASKCKYRRMQSYVLEKNHIKNE